MKVLLPRRMTPYKFKLRKKIASSAQSATSLQPEQNLVPIYGNVHLGVRRPVARWPSVTRETFVWLSAQVAYISARQISRPDHTSWPHYRVLFRSRLLKYGGNFSVKTGQTVSEHALKVHRRRWGLLHSFVTWALDGEVWTYFRSSRCTQRKWATICIEQKAGCVPESGWVL